MLVTALWLILGFVANMAAIAVLALFDVNSWVSVAFGFAYGGWAVTFWDNRHSPG